MLRQPFFVPLDLSDDLSCVALAKWEAYPPSCLRVFEVKTRIPPPLCLYVPYVAKISSMPDVRRFPFPSHVLRLTYDHVDPEPPNPSIASPIAAKLPPLASCVYQLRIFYLLKEYN